MISTMTEWSSKDQKALREEVSRMESTEGMIGDTNAVTKGSLAEPDDPHIADNK